MRRRALKDRSLIAFVAGITNINFDSVHTSLSSSFSAVISFFNCSITSVKVVSLSLN